MDLRIHIDGGSRGNPGPGAAAVVLFDAKTGQLLHEAGYFLGQCTNNVAEYQGLVRALEVGRALRGQALHIFSDSELMVRQVNGQYKVKSADLQPLFARAMTLLDGFPKWKMEHVLRRRNARADELANRAIDRGGDVIRKSVLADSKTTPTVAETPTAPAALSDPAAASCPCWLVRLAARRGKDCPAAPRAGAAYEFGPTTPPGFCIHAAAAVLNDGPMHWRDPAQRLGRTTCPRCGVGLEIEVTPGE
jgi:ribonuclease HI